MGLWEKTKQKSQASAKEAYKKKVQADKKKKKKEKEVKAKNEPSKKGGSFSDSKGKVSSGTQRHRGTGEKKGKESKPSQTSWSEYANRSKGEERRSGVQRAKERGNLATGLAKYTAERWAGYATKAANTASKRAIEKTNTGRKSGLSSPTRNSERANATQKAKTKSFYDQKKKDKEQAERIKANDHKVTVTTWDEKKKKNVTKEVKYNQGFIDAEKKIDKAKKRTLDKATKGWDETKNKEIPEWVDKIPGANAVGLMSGEKQRKTAREQAMKEQGLDNKSVIKYMAGLDADSKSKGINDDTVLENGQTFAEYKKSELAKIKADRDKINKKTEDIGKFSAKDIGEKGIEMASEMIDYAIPYAGTTGKAMKAAEKGVKVVRGAKVLTKTTKAGAKELTESGKALVAKTAESLVKNGVPQKKAIETATKQVMKKAARSDTISNIEKEVVANALQDATIGTALDAAKGKEQGLKGDEFKKYMLQNAAMNAAIGGPISAVVGRTGKAGKVAINKEISKEFNSALSLTKKEGKELVDLQYIKDSPGYGGLSKEQEARYKQLSAKAEIGGAATKVDENGRVVANDVNPAADALTRTEVKEYNNLRAREKAGMMTTQQSDRLAKLEQRIAAKEEYNASVEIKAETLNKMSRETGAEYRVVSNDEMLDAIRQTGKADIGDDVYARGYVYTDPETGKKNILINKDSQEAHHVILGHETTHLLSGTSHFDALKGAVKDYATTMKEYDAVRDEFGRMYSSQIDEIKNRAKQDGLSEEETIKKVDDFLDEEVTAELVGRYLFNDETAESFVKHLAISDRNVFQRIYDYIKKALQNATSSTEQKQLQRIKDQFDKAYKENAKYLDGRPKFELTGEPVSDEFAALLKKLDSAESLDDISVEEYLRIPEVAAAKKRVAENFTPTNEIKTPEREAMRNEWADKLYNSGSAVDVVEVVNGKEKKTTKYTGKVARERKVDIVIGLPASGKSSALVNPLSKRNLAKVIDSDTIKEMIPEFEDGWGAGRVHEESKQVLDNVLERAMKNGDNIVYPIVGGNFDSVLRKIWMFKNAKGGPYSVRLHLNELPSAKSAGRNLRRFAEDGRFVDLELTSFKYGDGPSRVYEAAKALLGDEVGETNWSSTKSVTKKEQDMIRDVLQKGGLDAQTKWNNDVERGKPPKRVEGEDVLSSNPGDGGRIGQEVGQEANAIVGEERGRYPGAGDSGRDSYGGRPERTGIDEEPPESGSFDGKYALSENKKVLHGGKGSASEYLTLKKVKKAHGSGDQKAIDLAQKETGWYLKDGKWQFDINISNMKFKNGIKTLAKKGEAGGNLGDELDGIDAVLLNYPDLKYATVSFGDTGGDAYTMKTGGKNLYGIVLDSGLLKVGLPKKEKNKLINDTMSTALQDVLTKIDEGKLARADAEDYAEELFDDAGIQKLKNMSKGYANKPAMHPSNGAKQTQSAQSTPNNGAPKGVTKDSQKAFQGLVNAINGNLKTETVGKVVGQAHKNYEEFVSAAKKELESLGDDQLLKIMDGVNFAYDLQNFDESAKIFKKIIIDSGDMRPTRETTKQLGTAELMASLEQYAEDHSYLDVIDLAQDVANTDPYVHDIVTRGMNNSVNPAKNAMAVAYIADKAGIEIDEAAKLAYSIWKYTSNSSYSKPGSYDKSVAAKFDKFVESSPVYLMNDGEMLYHGVGSTKDWKIDHLEEIWENNGPGTVLSANVHPNSGPAGSASSWTNSEETAKGFSNFGDAFYDSILVRCHNNITGAPIAHLSEFPHEQEVLFGTKAEWVLLNFERVGARDAIVDVIEKAPGSAEPDFKFALGNAIGESPAEAVVSRSVIPEKNATGTGNAQGKNALGKSAEDARFALGKKTESKANGEAIENYEAALAKATTEEEKEAIQGKIDDLKKSQTGETNVGEAGEQVVEETVGGEKATRPMELNGVVDRTRRTSTKGMNQTARNMIDASMEKYGGDKGFTKMIDEDADKNMFGKYDRVSKEEADNIAKQELEELGYEEMLAQFLRSEFDQDPRINAKRAVYLRNEIDRRIQAGEGDVGQLYEDSAEIVSKMSSSSSFGSATMEAMKEFAMATPEGRIKTVRREIARLESKYASRIPGGKLHVDKAKLKELASATGARRDELLEEINHDLWEQIPASLMERMNEYRHCFMLFNLKTHGRNVVGNLVFRGARYISDEMEAAILSANKGRIAKLEGKSRDEVILDRVHVTRKEVYDNRGYLMNEFDAIYKKSDSRNKFIELGRPDGVDTVKFKLMQKLINKNYSWLEKEDLKGALIPAFNKAYVSYCKGRCPKGKDLREFMENMTDAQKEQARHYALWQGEYATFRDTCAFSDWLTGIKQTFAGKNARTKWGTFGYRALDAVLEGAIPFVKTPVNIFRRSVDYSPASLAFSLGKLTRAKNAEEFKLGVHQFCTGLTGTGMMGFGLFLANQGYITVKTGEESGDEYYDRDMGYQDYSVKIRFGDKETTWTLDWMSPMGMSLFSGAALQKMLENKFDNQSILNAFFACTSPMTDMSFMSSPKDTIQRFMENASRGTGDKETDFGGALAQLIVGDLPKNYVSGFFPQLMAQAAGASDKYQRDTRSTAENVYIKGWESSARQLANKVPGLRQMILNPKINRRGEDVKNDSNIATRLVSSFVNPSNVKLINENETDRKLIEIRNHMDKDSKDYKYFYYNFTGNPSYNLTAEVNGRKRMTYDEAYTYGKANRIEQNKRINAMFDAKSYDDMTWKMKSDEVDDAHWIGTTAADLKTYGANYALKSVMKNNGKEREVVKEYKRLSVGDGRTNEEINRAYVNYYINKERLLSRSHATGDDVYRIKAITAIQSGDDSLLKSLDIHKSKIQDMTKYWSIVKKEAKDAKSARKTAFDELSDASCRVMSRCIDADITNPAKGVKSVAAGMADVDGNKIPERAYRAYGHNWNSAQAGDGLMKKYNKDGKYSVEKIAEMKNVLRNQYDVDESGSVNKDEVIKYIDSLDIKSDDEKACLYEVLYNGGRYRNPYKAQIDDHLEWGENRDDEWGGESSGGRRRGRRGHRGGHGGGGGGKGANDDWFKYAEDMIGKSGGGKISTSSIHDYTEKSRLNEAYRRRARKKQMATKKS